MIIRFEHICLLLFKLFLQNKRWQPKATGSAEGCSPTCCCTLSEAKRNALQDYQKSDGVRLVAPPLDSSHLTKSKKVSMAKCAKACSRNRRLPFTCRYEHLFFFFFSLYFFCIVVGVVLRSCRRCCRVLGFPRHGPARSPCVKSGWFTGH